jgi:hypothetical protein
MDISTFIVEPIFIEMSRRWDYEDVVVVWAGNGSRKNSFTTLSHNPIAPWRDRVRSVPPRRMRTARNRFWSREWKYDRTLIGGFKNKL